MRRYLISEQGRQLWIAPNNIIYYRLFAMEMSTIALQRAVDTTVSSPQDRSAASVPVRPRNGAAMDSVSATPRLEESVSSIASTASEMQRLARRRQAIRRGQVLN